MKESDIPQAIYATIIELLGDKARQKQNGDITIGGKSKHPIYITFFNEEKNSFRIKLWIGELTDELQMKAAKECCVRLNTTLYLTKLAIEKKGRKYGLCAIIDHKCYTQSEVGKFIPFAKMIIVSDGINAINFMNEKVGQLKNAL